MKIRHNISAANSLRNYESNKNKLAKDLEKLSSGYKINRAADDAAGLGVSEKMRAQITGLAQGSNNVAHGMALTNAGDGYLNEVTALTQRIRELGLQASNGIYDDVDRAALQKEIDQLVAEVDRITSSAEMNGMKLFRGEVGEILYTPVEYETITPMDPAYIYANKPFGEVGDVSILHGKQAEQMIPAESTHLAALSAGDGGGPLFPVEGIFIIRVGIPGPPAESRDAILDFEALNGADSALDGDFDLDDFCDFFRGSDTGTTDPVTGNPVYAGGAFSDWINAGELFFEVTDEGAITVKTTGLGGNQAHVSIGATTNVPAGKTLANSAILGTSLTPYTYGNNAAAMSADLPLEAWANDSRSAAYNATLMVDGVGYPVRVAEITEANESYQPQLNTEALRLLKENYMDCPVFWESVVASQGSVAFSLSLQERAPNPNYPGIIPNTVSTNFPKGKPEPEYLWPAYAYGDDPDWANDGTHIATYSKTIIGLSSNGATTLSEASALFEADCPTDYFSFANMKGIAADNFQVDRKGNVLFNWGDTSGLAPSITPPRETAIGGKAGAYSGGGYRVVASTAPNGPAYYAPNASISTSSITSNYKAKLSEDIGTLTISISNYGSSSVLPRNAVVSIDFNNIPFSPAAPYDSPEAIKAMVDYINQELNKPENRPAPPAFLDATYAKLLSGESTAGIQHPARPCDYTDYPVGFAYIDSSGHLAIRTAERNFNISVTENQSDQPMYYGYRSGVTGANQSHRLQIDGTPVTEVTIAPGDYADINEFIERNKAAFAPHYILKTDDSGTSLVIESAGKGATIDVRNISFLTPTPLIPSDLLARLGFDQLPYDDPTWFVDGVTYPSYQQELPRSVIGVEMAAKPLWIQSGPNNGDGLYIFLPHMSASSLGFADYKIPEAAQEEGITFDTSGIPETKLSVMTIDEAHSVIDAADKALKAIATERTNFGAASNVLEHTKAYVDNAHENIADAESRIRDVDMAEAMMRFTKNNILIQSSQAMLAQANQLPHGVLQLLQ